MIKPLLPERHPNQELFICDFGDVMPKSDIASMEHPLFTLSTKPDTNVRNYEHNGNHVVITPSILGHATIHDKDILIYCISQLMAGINRGETPSRNIKLKAYDLLVSTNRGTGGREYELLKKSLKRLRGTVIETNIQTGNQEKWSVFGILEKADVTREVNGRMVEIEIQLSEWLYDSIMKQSVLTISRHYFRLRKPLERRIYEISRKHCGSQKQWKIGLQSLHKKSGSSGGLKKFRFMLKEIENYNHLPDYSLKIEGDNVVFNQKNYIEAREVEGHDRPYLQPDTIEKAKGIVGRNFDIYSVEQDWLEFWINSGKEELRSPDGAFINFCKKRMNPNL